MTTQIETAKIKFYVSTGDVHVHIMDVDKKYRGFPGATNIIQNHLDAMGVEYKPSYGWDFFTATITLDQWCEIKTAMAAAIKRMKKYVVDDDITCKKCGSKKSDGSNFTVSRNVCDDCA